MRSLLESDRSRHCFFRDLDQCVDIGVKIIETLSLWSLHHHRLVNYQGEVNCRRVNALVKQTLCHIEGSDTCRFSKLCCAEDKFMLSSSLEWKLERAISHYTTKHIVRVEHCCLPHTLKTFTPQTQNVCVSSDQHSHVAMKTPYLPHRVGHSVI